MRLCMSVLSVQIFKICRNVNEQESILKIFFLCPKVPEYLKKFSLVSLIYQI